VKEKNTHGDEKIFFHQQPLKDKRNKENFHSTRKCMSKENLSQERERERERESGSLEKTKKKGRFIAPSHIRISRITLHRAGWCIQRNCSPTEGTYCTLGIIPLQPNRGSHIS